MKKIISITLATLLLSNCNTYRAENLSQEGFSKWLEQFKQEAEQKGISSATIDEAFDGVTLNEKVIALDTKQPERKGKVFTFNDYKARAVTQERINEGKKLLRENFKLLSEVEKKYGVQKEFIVSLWGIETNYGGYMGDFYIPKALASLAYEGRRRDFFKNELVESLRILEQGHVTPKNFTGSWAGAMGQCQFMPSTFMSYAVDFNGDNRKDIWGTKADVFGSAANYLSNLGWEGNVGWGTRVVIPSNFNKNLMGREKTKSISEWIKLGVKPLDKNTLPNSNYQASLIDVDGDLGTKKEVYLVYKNFKNIMQWNKSTYFATSVGLISDELKKESSKILNQR